MSNKKTRKPFISDLNERFRQVIGEDMKSFAKKIDVTYEAVRSWYNGEYYPKADQLANLKEKATVDINWLLTGEKTNLPAVSESKDLLLNMMAGRIEDLSRRLEAQGKALQSLQEHCNDISRKLTEAASKGDIKVLG